MSRWEYQPIVLEMSDTKRHRNDGCPSGFYLDQPGPHAFIQWKGTDACLDIYCPCGKQYHLDADFTYAVKCPACGKAWELIPMVMLVEQRQPCEFHEPILLAPETP